MRTVLVVEGGGLRGAFGAGVLAELAGHFPIEACYATSSGAPSAAYLLTNQIRDAVRIWEEFTSGSQLVAPGRLLRGASLMDLDRLIEVFRSRVRLLVERLPAAPPLYVAVTNCQTAQPEYLRCDPHNAFDLLKATMALPLAYGPTIPIDGVPYFDGGLTDSIPVHKALQHAAPRVVVVLTQPHGYRKRPAPRVARLLAAYYRRYPALAPAFARRFELYNGCLDEVERLQAAGSVHVIRPDAPLPASRLSRNKERIAATLLKGREAAQRYLAQSTGESQQDDTLQPAPALG